MGTIRSRRVAFAIATLIVVVLVVWRRHENHTFRDALVLSSDSPAADANGLIYVSKGDQLPLMPHNRLTLSADYTEGAWMAGANLRWQSSQYLAGDQSNQEAQMPGFTTVDVHGSYKLSAHIEGFAEIENLFDKRYFTYGAFTELDGLPPSVSLSDPRTFSPAPGRVYFAGVRLSL